VQSFEDHKQAPFSLHNIALTGESSEDKKVGEWFGPNTVCQVLKKLTKLEPWCSLEVHICMDSILITDEVIDLCQKEFTWTPLLLMIPLRLGITEINPIYLESLKRIFQFEGSLGVIGGKPNQALYFIGFVDDEVLYLDPHTVQRPGNIGDKSTTNEVEFDETFHQKHPNRINFQSIDPSIAICFLCKTKEEFEKLLENFKREIVDANLQPLFEISKNRLALYSYRGSDRLLDECAGIPEEFEEIKKDTSDEEFEIID
jgi:cysteine protease ATG4